MGLLALITFYKKGGRSAAHVYLNLCGCKTVVWLIDMKVVITAGGRGTRIASLNADIPKPLFPVNGIPVLEHQILSLKKQGVSEIIITIGYLGNQIKAYIGNGQKYGVHVQYIEENEPLGTAGALYFLRGKMQEDFFLINGDLIFDIDLKRMMDYHKQKKAAATLFVHPNDHPYDSGLIVAGLDGRVEGWLTKEDDRSWYQNSVNAGIHILSPQILEQIKELKKTDLDRDILKPRIPNRDVYAYFSPEYVKDMGTPDRIKTVEYDLSTGYVNQRNLKNMQKAIFLDRDGTINRYVGFLTDIEQFELLDGVAEAIKIINRSGYLAIVITNQPVIARGELCWEELSQIHRKMETLLGEKGCYIDDIFVCPHHPDKGFDGEREEYKIPCNCRKPAPGLLLQAAQKYHIDLSRSWMIGDSNRDIEAGKAAGCHTVRVSDTYSLLQAIKDMGFLRR